MNDTPREFESDRALHNGKRWLGFAVVLTLVPYLVALPNVLRSWPLIVEDDARHYAVWLRRLLDPELYPGDFIAAELGSRLPFAYAALYRPFIALGFDPLAVHLWVFMPLSGIVLTVFTYLFVRRFWPTSFGAAVAAVTFGTIVEASRGIPSDFGFAVVLGLILVFFSRRFFWGVLAGVAGAGMLPVAAATAGASLSGQLLTRKPPFLTRDRGTWLMIVLMGVGIVAAGVIAWTAARTMGEPLTAAEARQLPFYGPGGRRAFFGPTFASTYLCNFRAGIVPFCNGGTVTSIAFALLRTILVLVVGTWLVMSNRANERLKRFSLPQLNPQIASVWAGLVVAGSVLFVISHVVAFQLENPQRFSKYGVELSFVMIVSLTIAACVAKRADGDGWVGRWSLPCSRYSLWQEPAVERSSVLSRRVPVACTNSCVALRNRLSSQDSWMKSTRSVRSVGDPYSRRQNS
jgi:hypothetical protein